MSAVGSPSSPDCDDESTVGSRSPSSIKASITVSFATDLPSGQPTVHVLNQSTEALDRIYWAFSCQPPTGPIDSDGTATDRSQNATLPSLPDSTAAGRELADLSEAPVHTCLLISQMSNFVLSGI